MSEVLRNDAPKTPVQKSILRKMRAFNKKHKICNIRRVGGTAVCTRGTPCCGGCPLLKRNRCSVEAAGCTLYICIDAYSKLPKEVQDELVAIQNSYRGLLLVRYNGQDIRLARRFVSPMMVW